MLWQALTCSDEMEMPPTHDANWIQQVWPVPLQELLKGLCSSDPHERLTAAAAARSDWFSGMEVVPEAVPLPQSTNPLTRAHSELRASASNSVQPHVMYRTSLPAHEVQRRILGLLGDAGTGTRVTSASRSRQSIDVLNVTVSSDQDQPNGASNAGAGTKLTVFVRCANSLYMFRMLLRTLVCAGLLSTRQTQRLGSGSIHRVLTSASGVSTSECPSSNSRQRWGL